VNEKISKSSFLLDKNLHLVFIDFLNTLETIDIQRERYQIFNATFNKSQIIMYKSGIVVYQETGNLIKMLINFFKTSENPIPNELKKSNNDWLSSNDDKVTGDAKDNSTSTYWLSKEQIQSLLNYCSKNNYNVEEVTDHAYNYKICNLKGNCIFVSNNQIVHTHYSQVYKSIIENVIESHPIDSTADFFIGIGSYGIYSKIGPIIITAVGLTKSQSIKLQKLGVRRANIGRNVDVAGMYGRIQEITSFEMIYEIYPEDLNQKKDVFTDKLQSFIDKIQEQIPTSHQTIIYYDEFVKRYVLESKSLSKYSSEQNDESISTAATSIIAKSHFDSWVNKMSKKYKVPVNKTNLDNLFTMPERDKLLKLKLFERNR
jgi:ribonuclease HIII